MSLDTGTNPPPGSRPPNAEEINQHKSVMLLDQVPNVDATDCDNHVDGLANKVFTQADKDQIVQNALDISILLADPPVSADETFEYYANHYSSLPTVEAYSGSGTVLSYVLKGVTRYRFIPDPYDPTQEAFYLNFTNPNLTDLIVRKSLT